MNTGRSHSFHNVVLTTLVAGALSICIGASPAVAAPVYSARMLATQAEAALTAGHPGAARLDWERARLLAPHAPAIAAGLAKARAATNVVEQQPPLWRRLADRLAANEWAWIAVGGLVFAAAALVAFGWRLLAPSVRWSALAGGTTVAGLGLTLAIATAPAADRAVVVAPALVARIAPFAHADVAFRLPEGAVVSIRRQHRDYTLIAGPAGEGWVPGDAVETVLPRPEQGPSAGL